MTGKVYCWHVDKHQSFLQVGSINLGVVCQVCPKYPNKKFPYVYNISRKTRGMKLIFWLQINTKVFYKLLLSLWVCIGRHVQSTQNNKFAISLQELK